MATTGTEAGGSKAETGVHKVSVGELRGIIVDAEELRKGTDLWVLQGLKNLGRHGNKLYGEAAGSAPAPYRVMLTFGADGAMDVRARCTCPAARTRSFCKHAAALLIGWSRAPEAFVESEKGPADPSGKRKASVKKGSAKASDLMKEGVTQVATLVRELAATGVASPSPEQVEVIRRLGEALRENKLIRLSARTLDLANLLAQAAAKGSAPAETAYADLVVDLRLTARKIERHLDGESIDDRHVEELIGKRWRPADRAPVSGLDLVEYAYLARTTSDDFEIRESRLFDLASGAHYSEKQIVPGFLMRGSVEPKPSRGGRVLEGLRGSVFPGYPPTRLDITDLGEPRPEGAAAVARLIDKALPDVGAALAALQEHRKDIFAPDLLPTAIRIDTIFARGDRLEAVDELGNALHLPDDPRALGELGEALRGGRLTALLGDVGLDAALPTLFPLAAVIDGPRGLELRSLGGEASPEPRKAASNATGTSRWITAARAAGVSAAAIALGEVREELAFAFVVGLGGLSARTIEPLAARLRDLGLDKPAAVLATLPARPDAESRLDDFIKVYQVLGTALVRVAGATSVDRGALLQTPTYESVFVLRPEAWLPPEAVMRLRAEGKLNRYEAAAHTAHHVENLPLEALGAAPFALWADGSASPFIARALARDPARAVAAARLALTSKSSRTASLTAIEVLAAAGTAEAEGALRSIAAGTNVAVSENVVPGIDEPILRSRARAALDGKEGKEGKAAPGDAGEAKTAPHDAAATAPTRAARENATGPSDALEEGMLVATLLAARQKESREGAIAEITRRGLFGAIPALRRAYRADRTQKVRAAAALALGDLGDTEMTETFIHALAARNADDAAARVAIRALGNLGDARALTELLAALGEGYQTASVTTALRAFGVAARAPLLAAMQANPELAKSRAARALLADLPGAEPAPAPAPTRARKARS